MSGISSPQPQPEPAPDASLSTVDALAQLSFLLQHMLETRAVEHDLSLIQTRLLGILRDREPTMNELARLLDLDKSSISGLVDRAQRRGLVERVPSTEDRRAVNVRLTAQGRAFVTRTAADFARDVATLLDCLTPEDQGVLTRLAESVLVAYTARA